MQYAKINQPKHYLEIAQNFTDPREAVREAIQDSLDAGAKDIYIDISLAQTESGMSVNLVIEDNGAGIQPDQFSHFFDLSASTKREGESTGYKGIGTATYMNSESVVLESFVGGKKYVSVADKPYAALFNNQMIPYTNPELVPNNEGKEAGVKVTVGGYLKSTGENFIDLYSHPVMKDYILWVTAFASIRGQFEKIETPPKLYLRTYDSHEKALQDMYNFKVENGYEEISFGHIFPERDITAKEELKKRAEKAKTNKWEQFYCKRLFAEEVYIDGLVMPAQIVIWVEGDLCKKSYNPMLRDGSKSNNAARGAMYKVQDRYGFWVCKDYIPIQLVNDWVTGKGSYTRFHAFINYNGFSLTANRSSIDNTNQNTIKKIKDKLNEILDGLQKTKEFQEIQKVYKAADNERSAESEDADLAKRLKKSKTRKSIVLGNVRYYEPVYEGEAALLFDGILQAYPDCVRFEILDYNTNEGIDYLTREQPDIPLDNDNTVGYMELKRDLERVEFNHSFSKLRNLVTYDRKGIKPGEVLFDLTGKSLRLQKVGDEYILADYTGEVRHSIPLFVMKDFLELKGKEMN